jgi:hypothetical protein
MAVRIVIEKGPDQGKVLELDARAEMRIGRGPGNHLMVQDPAWQGALRVAFSQGVCKVTNQTPTTIYLGGKTFPPGEQRAWFHGESLQPTAQSLLVLYIEDASKAAPGAKSGSSSRKTMQITVISLCVLAAVLLFLAPKPEGADEARTPEQLNKEYLRLESKLRELRGQAQAGDVADRVWTRIREARFEQQRGRPTEAYRLYQRARAEVDTDLGTPVNPRDLPEELAETLRSVRSFINQQLIELGAESKKRQDQ